jgi:hypothetical protein
MASTSRREAEAAGRRATQTLKFVAFQGAMAVALLVVAAVLRANARAVALCAATLLVPVGWSVVYLVAYARVERARRAGTWSAEWERAQGRRAAAAFGAIMLVWILAALLIVLYA